MGTRPTLVLLFTTFPVGTETFLQREVAALRADGISLEIWSLWGGARCFEGMPVRRPSKAGWFALLGWLPYWALRRPRALARAFRPFFSKPPPNWINCAENLLGIALAIREAHRFAGRRDPFILHAVWASLPATFAWTLSHLTAAQFTFAGHAYDLFEDGGDWILKEKCRRAAWIRTSTEAGGERLREVGANGSKIAVIRRGLLKLPPRRETLPQPGADNIFRILSVGRLVPKMGYDVQVEVYAELQRRGVSFDAEIIGAGPEEDRLRTALEKCGLAGVVHVRGGQPFAQVEAALARAHLALFTGVVAPNGDRAGFPNFLGEAMAAGVPVVATPTGAVEEVLRHGENGLVATGVDALADAIMATLRQPEAARERAVHARDWVEAYFDARVNMRRFTEALEAISRENP